MNTHSPDELIQIASSLQKRGFNQEEITLQLRQQGAPENLLQEIIGELKKIKLLRKRNTGFACCSIGVVMLVVGCMLTLFLYDSGASIKFAMYGLTTIGVIFSVKGLVDIMGW